MRDRITLLILLLMTLWFFGSCIVVPVMKANRPGGPALAIDDVRDRNYLPPYVWPDAETLEANIREVVYGPLVTETYTQETIPGTRTINNSGPREVIEVPTGQPIALSDGRELNIRAYRIIPIVHDAGLQSYPVSGEVFVLPNGDIASEAEQKSIAEEFELDGKAYNASSLAGIPGFLIQVLVAADFTWDRGINWSLRDSLTGAKTSGLLASFSISGGLLRESQSKTVLVFAHNGIRPSPLILTIDLWNKQADPLRVGLSAPQSFGLPGQDFALISVQSFNQERFELTTLSGEDLPHEFTDRTWDHTRVTFDRLPEGSIEVWAILRSGERSRKLNRYGSEFRVLHPFEEIETLEMELRTEKVRVVIQLPDLPIYPEQNRDLRDVRQMVFPKPTVVHSRQESIELMNSLLQAHDAGGISVGGSPPGFPWDISGWTVEGFVQLGFRWHHDFVMHINDRGLSRWEIRQVGETRRRYRPLLARFYDLIQRTDVPLGFFLGLIALRQGWITMRSRQLLNHLRNLGYTTLGFWDADRLNRRLGKRAWRLPSHDELGSVPGVDPTSVASILAFMKSMKTEKRRQPTPSSAINSR
jgi:hypothetical protein